MNLEIYQRVIAIDWSGASDEATQHETIWMAEWNDQKTKLEYGLNRSEVIQKLIALKESSESMLVGFDFSFSLPKHFVLEHVPEMEEQRDIRAVWRHVAQHADEWLEGNESFWGRKGEFAKCRHKDLKLMFRKTEERLRKKFSPSSTFQIGGAGAVGTGSLRGMPLLLELAEHGFTVWPFVEAGAFSVVEIYPAIFTLPREPRAGKNKGKKRRGFMDKRIAGAAVGSPWHKVSERELTCAELSQDAFDALVSVMNMVERLAKSGDHCWRLCENSWIEGEIWPPQCELQVH